MTVAWLRIQSWIMCIARWGTRCEACADDAIACLLDAQEASTEMQRQEALTQQRLKDECANERSGTERRRPSVRACSLATVRARERNSAKETVVSCERRFANRRKLAQLRESDLNLRSTA